MNVAHKNFDTLSQLLDREVVQEIITIYEQQLREAIPQLKIYSKGQQFSDASKLAHKLKSSAMNIGAKEVGQIFLSIEKNPTENCTDINLDKISSLSKSYLAEFQSWKKMQASKAA